MRRIWREVWSLYVMLSREVSKEAEEYMVASPYDMTFTHRVHFNPDFTVDNTPQAAIKSGAKKVAEIMGWYDAQPTDDQIHFQRGGDSCWADVVYEEKPVLKEHYPGMRDDA